MCVTVGVAGARLMSTEQQLLFPSENVQASPNRPVSTQPLPIPGCVSTSWTAFRALHKGFSMKIGGESHTKSQRSSLPDFRGDGGDVGDGDGDGDGDDGGDGGDGGDNGDGGRVCGASITVRISSSTAQIFSSTEQTSKMF